MSILEQKKVGAISRKSAIFFGIIVIILIFAGYFYFTEREFLKDLNNFKKYFTENNQVKAHEIYVKVKKEKHKEKINLYLLDQLDAFKFNLEDDSFNDGDMNNIDQSLKSFKFYADNSKAIKDEYNKMVKYVEQHNYYKLGVEYFQNKEFVKAKEQLEKVTPQYKFYNIAKETIKDIPLKAKENALKNYGELLKKGDVDKALAYVNEALALNENNKELLEIKKDIETNKNEYLKNKEEIKKSLEKLNECCTELNIKSIAIEEFKYKNREGYKIIEKGEDGKNKWDFELFIDKEDKKAVVIKGKEVKTLEQYIKEFKNKEEGSNEQNKNQ